jgi:ribosome maturation protein Sdo1
MRCVEENCKQESRKREDDEENWLEDVLFIWVVFDEDEKGIQGDEDNMKLICVF